MTMDLSATHQRLLAACVCHDEGSVLELGAGFASTPLLNGLCRGTRRLHTVEQSAQWADQFAALRCAWHTIEYIEYANSGFDLSDWGVAFVDHAPHGRRVVDIARLKGRARLIVVHDTECPDYHYEPILAQFRFRLDDRVWPAWTSVVSDDDDLAWLDDVPGLQRVC
jgi:hypothetical protein